MNLLQNKAFRLLAALLTLLMFSGDLVADAICNATGACQKETDCGGLSSDSDQDDCPANCCSIGSGAAISVDRVDPLPVMVFAVVEVLIFVDQEVPLGALVEIDHPPQLS